MARVEDGVRGDRDCGRVENQQKKWWKIRQPWSLQNRDFTGHSLKLEEESRFFFLVFFSWTRQNGVFQRWNPLNSFQRATLQNMIHWDQTCWKYLDHWEDYCRVVRRWWMRLRMIFFNSSSSASTAFHSSCNKREMLAFPHQRRVYFREHFRNHLNRKVKCLLGILTNLHLSLFGMCYVFI